MSTVSAGIYAAVGWMPKELCKLIADYATETPHAWTDNEQVSATTVNGETAIVSDDNQYRWRMLVSAVPFAIGCLTWTVEFVMTGDEWIGAGVTLTETNRPADYERFVSYDDIARKDDWILSPFNQHIVGVFHNRECSSDVLLQPRIKSTKTTFRLEFTADLIAEIVYARVWRFTGGLPDRRSMVVLDPQAGVPDFRLLRPCVVVAGRIDAVVR